MNDLPLYFREGSKDEPLLVFIHGLGMSGDFWLRPENCRVIGGSYPLTVFLSDPPDPNTEPPEGRFSTGRPPERLYTSVRELEDEGYPVVVYSQKRPLAEAEVLIDELIGILDSIGVGRKRILFIGHSRGGLIARGAIQSGRFRVSGLITIGTPHAGSRIARVGDTLYGLGEHFLKLLGKTEEGTVRDAIRRVIQLVTSKAMKELLPDSEFLNSLNSEALKGIPLLTIGGTEPTLFTVYKWHKNCLSKNESCLIYYKEVFSFPDIIGRILPERLLPDEWRDLKGDGLVSVESAHCLGAPYRETFYLNHLRLVYDEGVRRVIKRFVEENG